MREGRERNLFPPSSPLALLGPYRAGAGNLNPWLGGLVNRDWAPAPPGRTYDTGLPFPWIANQNPTAQTERAPRGLLGWYFYFHIPLSGLPDQTVLMAGCPVCVHSLYIIGSIRKEFRGRILLRSANANAGASLLEEEEEEGGLYSNPLVGSPPLTHSPWTSGRGGGCKSIQ